MVSFLCLRCRDSINFEEYKMNNNVGITGINGQIGSYLAEDILENSNNIVHGLVRRASTINTERIDRLFDKYHGTRLFLHYGDLTDPLSIEEFVRSAKPDYFYNLAAQSHVKVSFTVPVYTAQCDALGELYVLEALKKQYPNCKLYQASTSEIYGGQLSEMPENGFSETSQFHPRSPYGVAKLYAYWITKNYRESYDMFACNGLLFNSESPRRGETFVTKKITKYICNNLENFLMGLSPNPLELGNLNAIRDWNHAKDAAQAMQLILKQDKPDDWVIGSGITTSVKTFVELSVNSKGTLLGFNKDSIKIEWRGQGIEETGWINDRQFIKVNPKYFRPAEVDYLKADPTKIKSIGWKPQYSIEQIVDEMIAAEK